MIDITEVIEEGGLVTATPVALTVYKEGKRSQAHKVTYHLVLGRRGRAYGHACYHLRLT